MTLSFGKQIRAWSEKTKEAPDAVFQSFVGKFAMEMNRTKSNGGALPHLTGNLMRSQVVTNGVVPDVSEGPFAGGDPGAAIATLEMGDTAYIGYQAKYAARQNYGFVGEDSLGRTYNQAGSGFVERAVQMAPALLEDAGQEVKVGLGL